METVTPDSRTRTRVLRLLLEHGPATAAVLAERLGVSPAGVRRHLDALVADGSVTARDARPLPGRPRERGRPAKVFALTDAGHAVGPSAYDDLAVTALRFLEQTGGPEAVAAFARHRVADLEERYAPALAGATGPAERSQALATALSGDGYAASTRAAGPGVQLCQHHCPVAHAAAEFPQLCDAETEVFSRLLGTHVQRLATLAHGDGVCTTHVPGRTA